MKQINRRQGKRETRDRILRAALDLFAREGFDAVTVKCIACRSGLTDGALYYYFPSKQQILLTLMEEHWSIARGIQALVEITSQRLSPEALDRLVDSVLDASIRDAAILRLVVRQCLGNDPLAIELRRRRRAAWREGFLQQVDERIRPEDAELLIDIILSVCTGIIVDGQIDYGAAYAEVAARPEFREQARRIVRRTVPLDRFFSAGSVATP
jgi:AcrR family transcriptional regulator